MNIEGVAAVTGAGQGIGLAVATELARRGFDVLALVLEEKQVTAVTDATKGAKGKVECVVIDITQPGNFKFPDNLSVLVNNAGIRLQTFPVEEFGLDDWRKIFEVNFFGAIEMSRRAIPVLRAQGRGVICNITSGSILMPLTFLGPYRAAKSALSSVCETLRLELAPFGIRTVEILPGFTESGLNKDSPARRLADAAKFTAYAPMAQALLDANSKTFLQPTPVSQAAAAIVDAILDDKGPMRYGTDASSNAGLKAWRESTDEEVAKKSLAVYASIIPKRG
jgi:NAD(P)-dependent dehydrogenase (short-subunit alcohol dehydrogenase family)